MANIDDWCFAWFQDSAIAGTDRQGMAVKSKWRSGETISISFLDGEKALRDRVREVAEEWLHRSGANIAFAWREDTTATWVRITFRGKGQWSLIGTDCKRKTDGPTMALGRLTTASRDGDVRRKTLHEFGHMLGMVHEHKLADAPIEWDRDAVYAELEGQWTRETIDENLFDTIATGEFNTVAFDPQSIMIYPIPQTWTKNGFSSEYNLDLSKHDLEFVRGQYG